MVGKDVNVQKEVSVRRTHSYNFVTYIYNTISYYCRTFFNNIFKQNEMNKNEDSSNKVDDKVEENPIKDESEKPHVRKKRQLIDAPYNDGYTHTDCDGNYVETFD